MCKYCWFMVFYFVKFKQKICHFQIWWHQTGLKKTYCLYMCFFTLSGEMISQSNTWHMSTTSKHQQWHQNTKLKFVGLRLDLFGIGDPLHWGYLKNHLICETKKCTISQSARKISFSHDVRLLQFCVTIQQCLFM